MPNYRTEYLENTIIIQGPKIANDYKALFENYCIGTFKGAVKNLLFSDLRPTCEMKSGLLNLTFVLYFCGS